MAKPPKAPPTPLADRIARARREGRTQQALELTRQLAKQEPSDAHRELLRQVTLERGKQLQEQNHLRDAATVFNNALNLGGPPEFLAQVAEHLAACGALDRALPLLNQLPDATMRQRALASAADAGLRAANKAQLPPELHEGFDTILQAFAKAEAGQDDEARAALQRIGLTSPFLEWKLLLRGLLAWYAHDDARALDNWQRLDPHRLPHRLAAPLRAQIDAGFRQAQPPAAQNALQRDASRLQGPGTLPSLQEVQKTLASSQPFGPAFRQAESALPTLKKDFPHLVPRLAHCFFWAIVNDGQPEDVDRYARVFGLRRDGAECYRLEAMALERRGMWPESHAAWQSFLHAIESDATNWPGETGKRAQALVWQRMGLNALAQEVEADRDDVPFLFGYMYDRPSRLKPGADECFEKSVKLAPDRLDAYLALFNLHRAKGHHGKAKKVGQDLLKRFPEHAATSEALGDLALETHDARKAREFYEKAISANPLERRLHGKLGRARQLHALELTVSKKFDDARTELEAALKFWEGSPGPLYCQWAVMEMKAGNADKAAELIARADGPDQRLAVRYSLVGDATRAKLTPAQRKQLSADLKQALEQKPTPGEVFALLESAALQRQRHVDSFTGQKTLERGFVRFLEKVPLNTFDETQMERLCGYLQAMDARRPWQRCLTHAEKRFPANPAFPLSQVEYHLKARDPERYVWLMRRDLDTARKLVQDLPREAQDRYQNILKQKEEQVREYGGGFDMMGALDNLFGGGPFGPDMDEDDGDDWP